MMSIIEIIKLEHLYHYPLMNEYFPQNRKAIIDITASQSTNTSANIKRYLYISESLATAYPKNEINRYALIIISLIL